MGYRARYDTRNGYVISGHAAGAVNNPVGTLSYYLSSNIIGQIRGIRYQSQTDTDVAFFSVDNSSYTSSNNVNGTSIYLSSTICAPAVGARLYKSGMTSGLTSADVLASNAGAYFSDEYGNVKYFFGLLKTSAMTSAGDSGGPAFLLMSSTSGRVGGIVTGGDSAYSYFTQAGPIAYMFGADIY